MKTERTFVMIKPDGVRRGLIGECMKRFERCGLKIVALKMVKPTPQQIEKHYPDKEEWFRKVGERTIKSFGNLEEKFGTDDPIKIGKIIKKWIVRFLSSGPVVVMVIEGNKAIDHVRRICGETNPLKAGPGSIRGDFSIDSVELGNTTNRPIVNVIHASGDAKEAENEINLWFKPEEILEYKKCDEDVFYKKW